MYNLFNKIFFCFFDIYEDNKTDINDVLTFFLTVCIGTFIKIYKEPNQPNKWRPSRFLLEGVISFLIGSTFYLINLNWLHLPYFLTMVVCVWAGSLSGKVYDEMDKMISFLFDSIKNYITNKTQ